VLLTSLARYSSSQPAPASVGASFGHGMNNKADVRTFTSAMMVDAVRPVILDLDLSTWVITVERPH